MSLTLAIVAPVFGLIAIGYLCGRFGLLAPVAAQGISDFAFKLALPVLLGHTVATAQFAGSAPFSIWLSFFTAVAITWVLASAMTWLVLRRDKADAPAVSCAATFGNTVMLGLPLSIATFGDQANVPVAIILSVHAPILLLAATGQAILIASSDKQDWRSVMSDTVGELTGNPIIVGILIGFAWSLTGLAIPTAIDRMMVLLAQAGVPVALVALGLTLVNFQIRGQAATMAGIIALKLCAMPVLAWAIGALIFDLPPVTLGVVVIMAAVPTGANAFLFAQRQCRAVNSTSGAVALGTLLGAATTAIAIAVVAPH